ncbi:hypothetical protein, partial [Campylobacter sp. IFREMER_LSEM_CL2194]|uniref:hypothetical protein n=1 Tax=Campylobacter sp. IFREMER_LSEM_CL2194 TaxID=2911621 RepID=UPI0021E841B5
KLTQENNKLTQENNKLTQENNFLFGSWGEFCPSFGQDVDLYTKRIIESSDFFETMDVYLLGSDLTDQQKFELILSLVFNLKENKMLCSSLLSYSEFFLEKKNINDFLGNIRFLSQMAIYLDDIELAYDFYMKYFYYRSNIKVNEQIYQRYTKMKEIANKSRQHGHDLLIDYIQKQDTCNEKICIEIGTTRENVSGQGSTMLIAKLCNDKNIKFITVDMDPHNTLWAKFVANKNCINISAITSKGEDYLENIDFAIDYLFLDAYDFDHSMHTELRQKQYEKNLGSRINDDECHKMHLKCAILACKKLSKDGIICIDDTWRNKNGDWEAKGKLAIPYLLENGFEIIEERNKAILLQRKSE